MSLDNLFLLNSIIFFIVYVIRYKNELTKKLIILLIGSTIILIFLYLLLLKHEFNIYSISKSILLFIALDQLYFYTFTSHDHP